MDKPGRALIGLVGGFVAAVLVGFALLLGIARLAGNGDSDDADGDPARIPADAFTIAVLPDTQYASEEDTDDPAATAFAAQTEWLAENADALDLRMVLHAGDLVDDACDPAQWERAVAAMDVLDDAGIPYAISAGNYDVRYYSYEPDPCTDGEPIDHPAEFIEHFPLAAAEAMPTFGGAFADDALNTFHTLDVDGEHFLVLALEFGPEPAEADWALEVAEEHPDHHVVVLTHDLVGPDGELRGGGSSSVDALPKPPRLTGAELWDRAIAPAPNVVLTLNGHVTEGTTGRSAAANEAGGQVHRLLANYQTRDDGRTGYLRLLTVDPAAGTIAVSTYSPVLDAWLTDDANAFTLTNLW